MKKRPSRRRSCIGKVKYSTLRHAQEAIAAVVPREKRAQFSAYQCSWCGMHHWGHSPREVREREEARNYREKVVKW